MDVFRKIARYFVFDLYNSPRDLMEKNKAVMSNNDYTINQSFIEKRFESQTASFVGFDKFNGTIEEFLSYENLRNYPDKSLLENIYKIKDDLISNLDLGGDYDANRLKFTSIPKGVFDFGMASKGLYRQVEYFDPETKRVINDKLIRSKFIDEKKIFYYNTPMGQKVVRRQQKGTASIESYCDDVVVKYNENTGLFLPYKNNKIFNGCGTLDDKGEKVKLHYATTIKKVFLYRESLGGGINDYVELYIPTSTPASLSPVNALAKNLPSLIVAEILEYAGVKTRIYGLNTSQLVVKNGGMCQAYVVKDFGENLDINKVTAFTSDVRFFRTQQIYQTAQRVGIQNNYDNSWSIKNANKGVSYAVDYANPLFSPLFNCYKNWVFNNKKSLEYNTKIQNQNLMIVGGLKSSKDLDFKTNKEATYREIENEVYRMLDYIGLMTSKNLRAFVSKVKERRSEQGFGSNTTKYYLLSNLEKNTQIVSPLKEKRFIQFSTPSYIAKQTREKVDEIIQVINEVL